MIPVLGDGDSRIPWGSLVSQPSLLSKLQDNDKPVLKKPKDALWPHTHRYMYTHELNTMNTHVHVHT